MVDNSYLASRSGSERTLVDVSENMLWWRVVRNLLHHLSDISVASSVTLVRLIVSMTYILAVVAGRQDVLLIDNACLDELHYLSVFEQQTEDASDKFGGCSVASKLLEYELIGMPLICIRRCGSAGFSSETICKTVDKLLSVCHIVDSSQLSDILVRRKCKEVVGVTWLHPLVMWSLHQRIFMHGYCELLLACQDTYINDTIILLCNELKAVADDIDQSVAELAELQKTPHYQFERNLFIIRHQLRGYEGERHVAVFSLHAH